MSRPSVTVSVVVPAHNAEHTLGDALDSVCRQSLLPAEVFVIDDGSTDDTAGVAESFGELVTLIQQDNLGQGAARNAGIARATGTHLAFLDADDFWEPRFLEATSAFLARHPKAVAVLTAWKKRLEDGSEILVPPCMTTTHAPEPGVLPSFFDFWAREGHVQTGAILVRGETVRQAGGMRPDLRVSQDLEYWALLATFGSWGFLPEPLYVNNSRSGAQTDWIERHRARWSLCPSVEQWQERVRSRIAKEQQPAFEKVRGQVAAALLHWMILGGKDDEARGTFQSYFDSMPRTKLVRFLSLAENGRAAGWWLAVRLLRIREQTKARRLRAGARFRPS